MVCFSLLILRADFVRNDWAFDLATDSIAAPHAFALIRWEVDTLMAKLRDAIRSPIGGMTEAEQTALVRAYFAANERRDQLERAAERVLSQDAGANVSALRAEIETVRRQQTYWRPIAEAAIEQQITAALRAEGLQTLGVNWPPVRFSFSEPPLYLIVSPRQRIERRRGLYLQPDTPLTLWNDLERQVEELGEVRVLVEGIGGFSTWPTMVLNDAPLQWALGTVTHEWMHTYLAFRPLGWHYFDSGDMTTINETVASIVGDEIGDGVFARLYVEADPPAAQAPPAAAFDFGVEMRSTRLATDALLAAGQVSAAEAFMEARRQRFLAAGYVLRKINQAYFAFHGSYATGVGAVDPIGPKLQRLRAQSPSLRAFVQTVEQFKQPGDLDRALQAAQAEVFEDRHQPVLFEDQARTSQPAVDRRNDGSRLSRGRPSAAAP